MNEVKVFKRRVIFLVMGLLLFTGFPIVAVEQLLLTPEETEYIDNNKDKSMTAVYVDGGAPLQYVDEDEELQGIFKEVLDQISMMTGFVFDYKEYETLEEMFESNFDIVMGISENYVPPELLLSEPYLKSETILYINASLDANQLDDKTYAAIRGSDLPEGIKEENAIYFDTREESLDAVESGKVDYGYGNAYSVAYYTLQNDYNNIVTIPRGKESREYRIALPEDSDILHSIINKSIAAIDESQMQTLILSATSRINRKITPAMIFTTYGVEILSVIFLVVGVLLLSMLYNIRAKNKLKIQNKRFKILSETSNEYLYEYNAKTNELALSNRIKALFGDQKTINQATEILKGALYEHDFDPTISLIEIPLASGKIGSFRAVSSSLIDKHGKITHIAGKLIDISEEEAERQALITKSQIDGLTGLYNAMTTKELIIERIKNKDYHNNDTLIIIDCDNFKTINDTYGHLKGNEILVNISESLKLTFSDTDIIGRIGGDEFCVYIKNVPSCDFVLAKCQKLTTLIQQLNKDYPTEVSIGAALLRNDQTYKDLFNNADVALYEAKKMGSGQIVIYNDSLIKKT